MTEPRVGRRERTIVIAVLCTVVAVGAVLLTTTGLRVFVFSPPLALLVFIIYRTVRHRQGGDWSTKRDIESGGAQTGSMLVNRAVPRDTAVVGYNGDLADRLRELLAAEPDVTEKSRCGLLLRVDPAQADTELARWSALGVRYARSLPPN